MRARIRSRSWDSGRILGYGAYALLLGILALFLIWPVSEILLKAFFTPDGFGFEYFFLLFANESYAFSLLNSIGLALLCTFFSTLITMPLAIFSTKWEFKGKNFLSALILLPMVMPPFVGAIGIQRLLARRGSLNLALMEYDFISSPIDWLARDNVFWVVLVLQVLHLYPIMYLNLSAALSNIDPNLDEVADTIGVPKWRRYIDLIWPLAKPGFFAGATIVFVSSLTDLGTPLLAGYHDTVAVKIFNLVSDANENPLGFALIFFVIMLTVLTFVISKKTHTPKKFQMSGRTSRMVQLPEPKPFLGWVIVASFLGLSFIAMIPHLSVLLISISDKWFMTVLPENYTTEHYAALWHTSLSLTGIKNSLILATLSTLLDMGLGVAIAYVIVRKLVRGTALLDALVMVPLALPGIVLAFGYVVTFNDTILDPLDNPFPLLILAYAIRRLPYMVRSAAAGLEQLHPSLEEASTLFGASRIRTLRKITAPLIGANLMAGALLCFAYAMLDVSDSLILAMKDQFYPMTKAIYALSLEQGSGDLIAAALGMIAMAILMSCIFGARMLLGKKLGDVFRV